jgi:hypothetical protein
MKKEWCDGSVGLLFCVEKLRTNEKFQLDKRAAVLYMYTYRVLPWNLSMR